MRYCPVPSVTAVRTFSIRAGLVASTVTPGSTAPEESLIVPAMTACAETTVGRRTIHARSVRILTNDRIFSPHSSDGFQGLEQFFASTPTKTAEHSEHAESWS